jgi:hypothetical protein
VTHPVVISANRVQTKKKPPDLPTTTPGVDDDHGRPEQPSNQRDDVPGHATGKHEGSVQPHGKDEDRNRVSDRSLGLAHDVVSQVKGHEEKREQGRDGQRDAVLPGSFRQRAPGRFT